VPNQDLVRKRIPVAIITVACFVGYGVLFFWPEYTGTQGALLRVGLLMAAFWLAMPSPSRPAAWKPLQSPWTLPGIIVFALLLPRLKMMLPLLAFVAVIAWFARPRKKR